MEPSFVDRSIFFQIKIIFINYYLLSDNLNLSTVQSKIKKIEKAVINMLQLATRKNLI
jgi:hypothetical protein